MYYNKFWFFKSIGADSMYTNKMNEWLVYSSADMVNWEEHPVPLKTTDFSWASGDAWASQVIERNGKFYWYVTVTHSTIEGKAIGIAVADSPIGPFKDALGKAIITNNMTTHTDISWDDIDPTVFIDDDKNHQIYVLEFKNSVDIEYEKENKQNNTSSGLKE